MKFDFDFSIWGDRTVPEQIARSRLGSSINVPKLKFNFSSSKRIAGEKLTSANDNWFGAGNGN